MSLEPGWRWSDCIKPVAGTDSCQAHHVGVLLSGTSARRPRGRVSEQDIGAGSAYVIEPGHDAWVVGDEAVVGYEFDARTAEDYAKGSRSPREERSGRAHPRPHARPLGRALRRCASDFLTSHRDIGRIPARGVPRTAGMP